MTDPEIEHRRLVSGDAAAVRGVVDALDGVLHTMVGVRQDLAAAAEVPVWSGLAAMAFAVRAAGLRQGLGVTRATLVRGRGALETAAAAYESAEDRPITTSPSGETGPRGCRRRSRRSSPAWSTPACCRSAPPTTSSSPE
ncbi:hypothetical protein [Nocardioides sp. P5_E3]